MTKTVDIAKIMALLKKQKDHQNAPVVELIKARTNDPFKILLATILSARTQDETTAKVCKKLFSKVKKLSDLDKLTQTQVEELVYPVSFYKNKAKQLKQLPAVMKEKFKGLSVCN